jgi:hypothetical protein
MHGQGRLRNNKASTSGAASTTTLPSAARATICARRERFAAGAKLSVKEAFLDAGRPQSSVTASRRLRRRSRRQSHRQSSRRSPQRPSPSRTTMTKNTAGAEVRGVCVCYFNYSGVPESIPHYFSFIFIFFSSAGDPCEWCFVAIDNAKEEIGCRRTYRDTPVRTKTSCEAQGLEFIWCPDYHENDSTLPDRTAKPTAAHTERPTSGRGCGAAGGKGGPSGC